MLITQREAVNKSYERYKETLQRPTGLYGTDTGHHLINMVAGGHVPTKIITVAMRAGTGKTSTLIDLAKGAARVQQNRRSELFTSSWEMEPSYLIDRAVCHDTGIPIGKFRYASSLEPEQKTAIMAAYTAASNLPVPYHPHSTDIYKLMPELEHFIRMTERKGAIEGLKIQPVFALDFIGRIQGVSKYSNKTYDIENFLQELKQFANDTGLAVYILAQLLRGSDAKDFPDVTDIKDSATIEDNSDTLILGHRPEYLGRATVKDPETGADVPSKNKLLMRVVKAR
jgi:replicative DNA helicase